MLGIQSKRPWLLCSLTWLSAAILQAAPPTDAESIAKIVGQPSELLATPAKIELRGPRDVVQVVISGRYADGSVRDLTPFVTLQAEQADLLTIQGSFLKPRQSGATTLQATVAGKALRVPVTVKLTEAETPVSFRHEIIPVLSVGGCNAGACHGTPVGKNGFRLSLRGFDPAFDHVQLTHDLQGRRSSRGNPDASLVLLKALGHVPHEGGARFSAQALPAQILRAWLAQGATDDVPGLPALAKLEIAPGARVLQAPARWQQLAVRAHFSDGSVRDVTRLTVFSSSENATAEVDREGLVEFQRPGEVAILARYLDQMQTVMLAYLEPKAGFVWTNPPEHSYIDKHVFAKLKLLSIPPSELCSDQEFIRRASLDLCATLPTPTEVQAFLADASKDKRATLVEKLLERPEYSDFWTMKWMDVLRSSRTNLGQEGVEAYRKWLKQHIGKNTPLDAVVRELLTASGDTFEVGPANYYRATREPNELAETTAQLFFGVRMQCAKCHNHPFEKWTQDDYYTLAAFFAGVKQKGTAGKKGKTKGPEVISYDARAEVKHPATGAVVKPRFLGGEVPSLDKGADRREAFARWLTAAENPFFARSVVNRVWFHLLGRGIVDPVDDFRESNPPANEALLDALAKDFVAHKYDLKHLLRTIMHSRTYQLSALSNKFNKDDSKYFSHTLPKMLTAEQLLDALCQVTEVPEKYKDIPAGTRAIQLPDGEVPHPFLKSFNKPARDLACECERESESSLAQALQLINGATVHAKLTESKNRLGRLLAMKTPTEALATELYLAALSRSPSASELQAIGKYVGTAADVRRAWEDVLWTLLNTKEFMYRH